MLFRRLFVLFLFFLVSPFAALGGELSATPAEVVNGGAVVLRWEGDLPSFAVVRFNDQVLYLYPDRDGAVALLPIPLEMPAGVYPVLGAVVDQRGESTPVSTEVHVSRLERSLEKLTLPKEMVSPKDPVVLERIARERARLGALFSQRTLRLWDDFVRPVSEPVSSVFGKRRLLNGQPRAPHSGTDFRSPVGTPVHAMSTGRVVLNDALFYTGNTVVLDHGEGLFSLYAHLSSSQVGVGELIPSGAIVGKVGSTGRSTGPHLHLTVRLLGDRIDPLLLLAAFQRQGS